MVCPKVIVKLNVVMPFYDISKLEFDQNLLKWPNMRSGWKAWTLSMFDELRHTLPLRVPMLEEEDWAILFDFVMGPFR